MEFSVPRHGAAIVSGWCAALGAMLCLPFWKNFFTPTLAVFLLWLAACFGRAGAAAGFVLRAWWAATI